MVAVMVLDGSPVLMKLESEFQTPSWRCLFLLSFLGVPEWALHVVSIAFLMPYLAPALLSFDVCRYISFCVAVRLDSWA